MGQAHGIQLAFLNRRTRALSSFAEETPNMARRRWGKILGITVVVLLVLISLAITFTIGWRPIIGPRARTLTDRKFASTSARLERGKYLVNSVMGCVGCHSDADLS